VIARPRKLLWYISLVKQYRQFCCNCFLLSWCSVVTIVTVLQPAQSGPKHPAQLLGPPTLPIQGVVGFFPGGKAAGV